MVDETNIYGSAVIYVVYFSVTWSMRRTLIWKCCNLHRIFLRGMVDETNIYGSAVIYAVYFTVSPFISGSLSDFFCSFLGMVAETKVTWATR